MYYNSFHKRQSEELIRIIEEGIRNTSGGQIFFQWIINNIPSHKLNYAQTQRIIKLLTVMRDNEANQNILLKEIYKELTGVDYVESESISNVPLDFIDGLTTTLLEIAPNAVKRYRTIRANIDNEYYRDMLLKAIIQEINSASTIGYIYQDIIGTIDED